MHTCTHTSPAARAAYHAASSPPADAHRLRTMGAAQDEVASPMGFAVGQSQLATQVAMQVSGRHAGCDGSASVKCDPASAMQEAMQSQSCDAGVPRCVTSTLTMCDEHIGSASVKCDLASAMQEAMQSQRCDAGVPRCATSTLTMCDEHIETNTSCTPSLLCMPSSLMIQIFK